MFSRVTEQENVFLLFFFSNKVEREGKIFNALMH